VALNNNPNIPSTTKILIGEVANQTAGGYTIFNPKGTDVYSAPYAYDQDNILEQLNTSLSTMKNNSTDFGNIKGVMLWSLNNDYSPSSWNDPSATAGAFCSKIFGAAKPSPTSNVYFILQVSNTGNYKNASVTLAVNGQYYIFGYGSSNGTIPATSGSNSQCWGTLASSKDVSGVLDSSNLDTIFSNGTTSFSATVIGNSYNDWQTSINNPDKQTSGTSYTFEAGKSYNVMVNPDSMAMEIKEVSSSASTGSLLLTSRKAYIPDMTTNARATQKSAW
jgi:hypothetical protein